MQYLATNKNPFFGRPRFYLFRTRKQCAHAPQHWPWWKWFAFRVNHLTVALPSTGRCFWFYTRWGAIALDVVIDRRGMLKP